MGIDSSLNIFYGFLIPKSKHSELLKVDEDGYYEADEVYTHELDFDHFVYGKNLYAQESRHYFWAGNQEVVDISKGFILHHMQKRKVDRIAEECNRKADYIFVACIS